jgi:oxygen-independent coproporphyrinogen-3 oxidase
VHFPWCLKKCPYCDFLSIAVDPERLQARSSGSTQGETGSPDSNLPGTATGSRRLGLAQASRAPLDAPSARAVLPHDVYARAVRRELDARLPRAHLRGSLRSVFFGGGTPSLWDPAALGRVLRALLDVESAPAERPPAPAGLAPADQRCPVEITVECNPTSFDVEHAKRLLDVGVNRVSLGVQSLDGERLGFLGRLHDAPGGLRAVEQALRAGVPRVNADLIFGVSGQSPEAAAREVRRVAETGVTHVSAYALTIEPGTQFGALAKRGKLPLLDDALVAESFEAVEETLTSLGFAHYEVSNYARDDHYAEHNLGYWRGEDYLGLGVGAWGTVTLVAERLRYRNTPSIERYLDTWSGAPPSDPFSAGAHLGEREPIDAKTALSERILLGLRLAEGLDLESAAAELGVPAWPAERRRAAERLRERGRLVVESGRLRIPHAQWLYADGTISELL